MSEVFQNVLTITGQQKKAAAEAGGAAVNITHFKVGDSNGIYYTPLESQTDLVHPTYTGSFIDNSESQIIVNPSALNEVLYKCFIPANVGGFTIRELGLFDNENNLILICKLPAQDKFALDSGLYQPLTFTPRIIYTNPAAQAVLTPNSQIIATQTYVNEQVTEINQQISEINQQITETAQQLGTQIDDDIADHNIDLNAHSLIISDFSRAIQQRIIDRISELVSSQTNIKRLLFFDETGNTATLKDRSVNAQNALLSANASALSPSEIENCRTLNLSNSASVEFNDADDLSFVDGVNDKPFTIIALINPNTVNNGHILSKNDLTPGSYKREYVFYFDAFNKLHGRIYDNASGAYLDRFYDTQILGDVGTYHTYVMTYDGSKTSAGLKLYRDGIKVDNQGVNSGVYSSMANTAAKLGNFYVNSTKQAIGSYKGAMLAVIAESFSASQIKDIDILLRGYVGMDVVTTKEDNIKINFGNIYGLELSNSALDSNNDIEIAAGFCASNDSTPAKITLLNALTKQLDASFTEGTNKGGLDTGSKANNLWYHVFAVSKADKTADILFSTSVSNPIMPSGFIYKRRIGSIKTDSNGNILGFIQLGEEFHLKDPVTIFSGASAWGVKTVISPLGIKSKALLYLFTGYITGNPAAASELHVRAVGATSSQYYVYANPYAGAGDDTVGDYDTLACSVIADTLSQIEAYCSHASALYSVGWVDYL